jgi:hypothetical protein
LTKQAAKAGLPKTSYIRHLINGLSPKEAPPADYYKMMRELYAMGNNLNQLAAVAHTLGWVQSERLNAAVEALSQLVLSITHEMMLPETADVKAALRRGKVVADADLAGE